MCYFNIIIAVAFGSHHGWHLSTPKDKRNEVLLHLNVLQKRVACQGFHRKKSKVPKYFKLADNNVSVCSLCKMSLTFPSCTTTTCHRRHLERRRTGATVEGGGCFLLFSCFIVCCAELSSFDEIVFC